MFFKSSRSNAFMLSLVYNATPPLENLEPVVNVCLYPPMVILVSKPWFIFSEVSLRQIISRSIFVLLIKLHSRSNLLSRPSRSVWNC